MIPSGEKRLSYRQAQAEDLDALLALMVDDELGKTREHISPETRGRYEAAFRKIQASSQDFLMVVLYEDRIVGTCQLTLIPSLTFGGTLRMQIECVRVASAYRGQGIGQWMLEQALAYARSQGAQCIQLTTHKKRTQAKRFYEKLGFEASHEGLKLWLGDA